METHYLVNECKLSKTDLQALKLINSNLFGYYPLACYIHDLEPMFDKKMYLNICRDISEIEREYRNNQFKFNAYIIKLILIKIELLLSNITVKSEDSGIELFSALSTNHMYIKTILNDLKKQIDSSAL